MKNLKFNQKTFLLLFLIILDQILKLLAIKSESFFYNQNGFLNWGEQLKWRPILSFILLFFLIFYWFLKREKIPLGKEVGFLFLIAGGLSNCFDIWWRKGVVDFINLKIWPVFNLADLFISFGVILILIYTKKSRPI